MEYQVLEPLLLYPDKMARFVRISSEKGLEGTPLKPHHIPFIIAIGNGGGISQKELCARIPVDKSRVSTVVHELMLMGLAYNGSGGKTWSLELTDAGRKALLMAEKTVSSICDDAFGSLSQEELDSFASVVSKIESRIYFLMASRFERRFPVIH
jgi:DNA-binding MarR family transcriptional regulator